MQLYINNLLGGESKSFQVIASYTGYSRSMRNVQNTVSLLQELLEDLFTSLEI